MKIVPSGTTQKQSFAHTAIGRFCRTRSSAILPGYQGPLMSHKGSEDSYACTEGTNCTSVFTRPQSDATSVVMRVPKQEKKNSQQTGILRYAERNFLSSYPLAGPEMSLVLRGTSDRKYDLSYLKQTGDGSSGIHDVLQQDSEPPSGSQPGRTPCRALGSSRHSCS